VTVEPLEVHPQEPVGDQLVALRLSATRVLVVHVEAIVTASWVMVVVPDTQEVVTV
jgi:hypothetical protein